GAPKIFWSTLKSFKNILVGSNGVQGELFDILLLSSRQRVEKYIQKLDYIEIPHPDLFDSYLDRNQLTKDQLLESLQILISLAKKHNKLIISTAEPRYRHKGDREIFKVLTSFPIRDKRHFLWNYKAVKAGNYSVPNFYFLTTDEMLDAFSFLEDKSLIEDIVVNNAHKLNN
ncbi:PolC-type DNA polymerase III, partial [Mycoplasmopsis pullorum]